MNALVPMEFLLERDGHNQPWGFRLQGGQDVGVVLSVQRILCGTPSEGVLKKGDVVVKIGNNETKKMSHQAAVDKFTNAGNQIQILIKRPGVSGPAPSASVQGPAPVPKTPPVSGGVALPGMTPPITTSNKNPLVNLSKPRLGGLPAAPKPYGAYDLTLQSQVTGSLQQIQNQGPVYQGAYCIATDAVETPPPSLAPLPASIKPLPKTTCFQSSSPVPLANSPIPIPRQSPAQGLYQSSPPIKIQSDSPAPMAGFGAQGTGAGAGAGGAGGAPKVYNNPIGLYSKENITEVAKLNQMGTNPGRIINPPQPVILNPAKDYNPTESETWKVLQESSPTSVIDPQKTAEALQSHTSLKEHDPIFSDVFKHNKNPPPVPAQDRDGNLLEAPNRTRVGTSPVADLLPPCFGGKASKEPTPEPNSSITKARSPQPADKQSLDGVPIYETNIIGDRRQIAQSATFKKVMSDMLGD